MLLVAHLPSAKDARAAGPPAQSRTVAHVRHSLIPSIDGHGYRRAGEARTCRIWRALSGAITVGRLGRYVRPDAVIAEWSPAPRRRGACNRRPIAIGGGV